MKKYHLAWCTDPLVLLWSRSHSSSSNACRNPLKSEFKENLPGLHGTCIRSLHDEG